MIELMHNIDAKTEIEEFTKIMLSYCHNGIHQSHRAKMNEILEHLIDMNELSDDITNDHLDTLIIKFNLIDEKYLK